MESTYLLTDGEFLKVGKTSNIDKRISSLQTGNARRLTVLGIIDRDREKQLHECLGLRGVARHTGEWFDDNVIARDLLARYGLLDATWKIDGLEWRDGLLCLPEEK